MSTAGAGSVAAVGAVGVGVVAGAALLAGAAVIGTGILIGRGLVWCGQKLEENYQNACKEWTNVNNRAYEENMRNVQDMSNYLADQLDCMAASSYLTVDSSAPQTSAFDMTALNKTLSDTQSALDDAQKLMQGWSGAKDDLLIYRLKAEIETGRGILSSREIARAESALKASPEAMQQALEQLQAAWQITETGNLLKRNERQARQILQGVRTQLTAIDAMLPSLKGASRLALTSQQSTIEAQVRDVEASLSIHPAKALHEAQQADQATRQLVEAISAEMIVAWNERRKEINALHGMVNSLAKMMLEADTIQLLDAGLVHDLNARIQKASDSLHMLEKDTTPQAAQRVKRTRLNVEILKQAVFSVVKTTQQRNVAKTIAATLSELGFQGSDSLPLTIQQQGDTMRVQAVVNKGTSPGERDEKIVAFDIDQDGAVAYDFSGYAGDSCIHDAQRVFAALCQKGVFILDEQGSAHLRNLPAESVSKEILQSEQFAPTITRNKTQAELAESLKRVLEKMGYPSIQQRTIGGSIELEAFQGQVGYRIVLSPDGEARILKDAQRTDVSGDSHDPVSAEAQRTIQQAQIADDEEVEEEQSLHSYQPALQQKRQQAIG